MTGTATAKQDPYLKKTLDFTPPPIGMTPLDQARRSPGPSLVRTFEVIKDREQKVLRRAREEVLCRGAAAGEDATGIIHHFTPGLRFRGFIDACSDPDLVVLKTRGSVLLRVEGATDRDRGKSVHCHAVNAFSLQPAAGSQEIGLIRYVDENGRCAVAFCAAGDERPLDMRVATR